MISIVAQDDERYAVYVGAFGGSAMIDANLVTVGGFDYDTAYRCAKSLLRHEPACIVAANDHMALGVFDAVIDAGLSVPGDIAVTGWDDMREIRRPTIGLTTVRQDIQAVGREATSILLELLAGATGPIQRTLPTSRVVRESTMRQHIPQPTAGYGTTRGGQWLPRHRGRSCPGSQRSADLEIS